LISVIVCSYNGAATIRDTLDGLTKIKYPNFEIIVVNDGSTDNTASIVADYNVKLISTNNHGLSNARNTGMYNASGEILAYIDDDAYPDEHWLHYLAYTYTKSSHASLGGPNIIPSEDGPIATCVANAPGGPVHVLQTDEIAEHIPGCNFSVRKDVLLKIGGFDPIFRAAGDDVDICWRIQEAGHTIGFNHSAVVWHHRRNSLKAYWKQQKGYGKAEALLEAKWPEKYNAIGHLSWLGRIYGNGITLPLKTKKDKIFHGTWGTALFQSIYQPANGLWNYLPLMPEWYLVVSLFGLLLLLGFFWTPLLFLWPLFVASISIIFVQAFISSNKSKSLSHDDGKKIIWYRALIILLHVVQPVARLYGRILHGLTPWRKRGAVVNSRFLLSFLPQKFSLWSEMWQAPEEWLAEFEKGLVNLKSRVIRGNDFDNWDLQIRNGLFGKTKCLLAIEEHGAGKQYLRLKCWKQHSLLSVLPSAMLFGFSIWAGFYGEWIVVSVTGILALGATVQTVLDGARSMSSALAAFNVLGYKRQVDENLDNLFEDIAVASDYLKKDPVFIETE
jgi:O-antigen biosynthesis protein